MSFADYAAAIDGKTFMAGTGIFFARGAFSSGSMTIINGQPVYTGNVFRDANHVGINGTITVLDISTGTVRLSGDIGGTPIDREYQILGADANGSDLVLGTTAGAPDIVISAVGFSPTSNHLIFNYDSRNSFDGAHLLGVVTCFVQNTRIKTPSGEVAVEHLSVGDIVVTASNEEMPIVWIGHQTLQFIHSFNPSTIWPVCIAANAFGNLKPARDLFLSSGHAIWVPFMNEGAFIPVGALLNGRTITQQRVQTVTYWHVQLERHDILVAEGLPTESYLDAGNSALSAGWNEPDRQVDVHYCRPFFDRGPVVIAVRHALAEQASKLGWMPRPNLDPAFHIEIGNEVILPSIAGDIASFAILASSPDVFLVSETIVPYHVSNSEDNRNLGIRLASFTVIDSMGARHEIPLSDSRLCSGFHEVEEGARWTSGKARLPKDLWESCQDTVILEFKTCTPPLPRWEPPQIASAPDAAQAAAVNA